MDRWILLAGNHGCLMFEEERRYHLDCYSCSVNGKLHRTECSHRTCDDYALHSCIIVYTKYDDKSSVRWGIRSTKTKSAPIGYPNIRA
jgi:hypothetical protein